MLKKVKKMSNATIYTLVVLSPIFLLLVTSEKEVASISDLYSTHLHRYDPYPTRNTSLRISVDRRSGISDQKLAELEFRIGRLRTLMRLKNAYRNNVGRGVIDFDRM